MISKLSSPSARILLCLVLFGLLSAGAAGQKRRARPKQILATVTVSASKPTPAQRRMEAFQTAWSTIHQQYFDKSFGGLDWNRVRTEFQPRVAAAKTDAAFHQLLEEMLGRLGKSHLSVIVPEYFANLEAAKKKARKKGEQMSAERRAASPGGVDSDEEEDDTVFGPNENARFGIGVELRMLDGRIVISSIDEQSGAVVAGLKPGFIIEKINGISIPEVIRQARIDGSSETEIGYLLPIQLVDSFLNGDPDTSVFLTCLDQNDKTAEFTVPRLSLAGQTVSISRDLPEQFLKYEARSLSSDVGYIKFNAFAVPVIAKFCDSLTAFRDKKAIIVDLRGNLGGILGSMMGLAGMLSPKDIELGTYVTREGRSPFVAQSKNKNFKGRLVIMVDSLSMSAAELFTAGLQGRGRAVVVGERSGGQSLPAIWTKLSTGAVMLYPVADFITPRGVSLEGAGLLPDHIVALDRGQLLKGVDTQLERAIAVSTSAAPADEKKPSKLGEVNLDRLTAIGSAPPPPPPKAVSPADTSGPPPPPAKREIAAAPESDARSLNVIRDFAAAIGGYDNLNAVKSYEGRGSVITGADGGNAGDIYVARQWPDKFVTVLNSPTLGEVREIYNGKQSFLQADYGFDGKLYEGRDTTRVDTFSPIFNSIDLNYLKELKYEGEFELEGRKRHIISGKTSNGSAVGLSFDSVSKMLVTYAWEGILYTLDDYRQVGSVKLPHSIDLERFMTIKLASVTINGTLDPKTFEKVEKCYDKAN